MSDKLYIRTDANEKIAMGHVMRCLSIADAFVHLGGEVEFLVADRYVCDLLEKRGYFYQVLGSNWAEMEGELEQLKRILCAEEDGSYDRKKPKLLVDSYQATKKYLKALQEFSEVIYLDDLNRFKAPVSLLINYVSFQKVDWKAEYNGTDTSLCLGWQYTPLRLAFADCCHEIKKEVTDILLTTGGSDPYEVSVALLEKLLSCDVFALVRFHVVAGRFCTCMDKLQQVAEKNQRVKVYQNIDNMAELMCQCDLAVSAGGTTLFELFACQVPVLAFGFADNQLESLQLLEEQGALYNVGDIRRNVAEGIAEMAERTKWLCMDYEKRSSYALKGHNITDGQGAFRIAEAIKEIDKSNG